MSDPEILHITKMDAARRQFATAIRLWFADDDPVATHTLLFAAHEILHTLFKRAGLHGLLYDSDVIKDEFRSEFAKAMAAHAVFFKHARHDPDGVREFNPRANEAFLLFNLYALQQMSVKLAVEEHALLMWLIFHRPSWFEKNFLESRLPVDSIAHVRDLPKHQFFEGFRAHWRG